MKYLSFEFLSYRVSLVCFYVSTLLRLIKNLNEAVFIQLEAVKVANLQNGRSTLAPWFSKSNPVIMNTHFNLSKQTQNTLAMINLYHLASLHYILK